MYSLELSLRYSPFPLSIQKKEFDDVKRIYEEMDYINEACNAEKFKELHSKNSKIAVPKIYRYATRYC